MLRRGVSVGRKTQPSLSAELEGLVSSSSTQTNSDECLQLLSAVLVRRDSLGLFVPSLVSPYWLGGLGLLLGSSGNDQHCLQLSEKLVGLACSGG